MMRKRTPRNAISTLVTSLSRSSQVSISYAPFYKKKDFIVKIKTRRFGHKTNKGELVPFQFALGIV